MDKMIFPLKKKSKEKNPSRRLRKINERLIKHRSILFTPCRLHFTIITFL